MAAKKVRDKKTGNVNVKILVGAFLMMCLGYFLLNYVATWEEPYLGNTFHIVAGCTLIAVSAIVIIAILKRIYFPKKKRKKHKPVFLDDEQKRSSRR